MSAATMNRPAPSQTRSRSESPIPFSRLVHIEWGKATDTRAARWLLGLTGFATIAIMLAPLIATGSIEQTWGNYLQFTAFGLASLLPVVSILTLTSEWSQRTVLATFTQEPRRARVIGAKVAVSGIMTVAAIVFGLVVTAAGAGISSALGRDVVNDLDAGLVLGWMAFLFVNIMMGVAFGALLHNSAAAIVLFFLLPTVFGFLGAALKDVGKWIDTGTTFNWMLEGEWSGHVPNILVSAVLWLVLPLIFGLVRTARREIK